MKQKTKLTKTSRLALIASLCSGGMAATLAPTRHDIAEEAQIVTHHQDAGLLPINDDLPSLSSSLPFERVKEERESVDAATLTQAERKALARDLLNYRIKRDLSARRNPFALAII
jgi:hypothetical protein